MVFKKFLTISEFAKISGVSRQTLIYYDRIGLFSPTLVAENNYRMYSHNQIWAISTITMLSGLGVPLKEIRILMSGISPETITKTLEEQLGRIESEIKKFTVLRDMIRLRIEQIDTGCSHANDAPSFSVVEIEEDVPFYLGERVTSRQDDIFDDGMAAFFTKAEQENVPMIFAIGYVKAWASVKKGDYRQVSRIGFRLNNEQYANHTLPKGKYVVGYGKGDYGKTDVLYRALLRFVDEQGVVPTGDVYEEYLIDEMAEKDPENFVLQISVRID